MVVMGRIIPIPASSGLVTTLCITKHIHAHAQDSHMMTLLFEVTVCNLLEVQCVALRWTTGS